MNNQPLHRLTVSSGCCITGNIEDFKNFLFWYRLPGKMPDRPAFLDIESQILWRDSTCIGRKGNFLIRTEIQNESLRRQKASQCPQYRQREMLSSGTCGRWVSAAGLIIPEEHIFTQIPHLCSDPGQR
ncbi:hypothetical protein [Methanosarcina horonobensis]|nr:hypothetical protein [Methanosarcina horonobensis]